jgi:hypothetical protein
MTRIWRSTHKDRFIFLHSKKSRDDKHGNGVGLLLNKSGKKSLIEWHPVSERLMMARFKAKIRNVAIIHCYASTEISVAFAKQTLCRLLYETTMKNCKTNFTLLFKLCIFIILFQQFTLYSNFKKVLIKSNYVPACFVGAYRHHQGIKLYELKLCIIKIVLLCTRIKNPFTLFINIQRGKHRRNTAGFVQQNLRYGSRMGVVDNMEVLAIVALWHPYN